LGYFDGVTGSQALAWEPRSRGSASLADKNRRQSLMECVPRLEPIGDNLRLKPLINLVFS